MGLKTFVLKNVLRSTQWTVHSCENLSSSIHSRWPRPHHVTINLWQQNILTTLFWCSLKRSSVKLTKLLFRCLNAPWKSFYITYRSSDLRFLLFVTFWKLICSRTVAPCWLDDPKECIQSAWSKQRDYCSLAHECWSLWKLYFSNISRKLFAG